MGETGDEFLVEFVIIVGLLVGFGFVTRPLLGLILGRSTVLAAKWSAQWCATRWWTA
jgi:hypothetical protein